MHMELAVNTGSASLRARGFKYSHVTSKLLEADSAFLDASLCNVDRGGGRKDEPRPAFLVKVLKQTLVAGYHPQLRGLLDERSLSHAELPHQTQGTHCSKPQGIPRNIIDQPPAPIGGKAAISK